MRILVSNTWPLPGLRDRGARIRATGDSLIIVVASFIRSLRNRIMSADNRWLPTGHAGRGMRMKDANSSAALIRPIELDGS